MNGPSDGSWFIGKNPGAASWSPVHLGAAYVQHGTSATGGFAFGATTTGSLVEIDSSGTLWANFDLSIGGKITDNLSVDSIDTNARQMFDSAVSVSVDYTDRKLTDQFGNNTVDWNNCNLNDDVSATVLWWAARKLYANDGTSEVIDFSDASSTVIPNIKFTPADSAVWDGDPTTIAEAINRIAAVVGSMTPIPA